jgi:hypothetical protein
LERQTDGEDQHTLARSVEDVVGEDWEGTGTSSCGLFYVETGVPVLVRGNQGITIEGPEKQKGLCRKRGYKRPQKPCRNSVINTHALNLNKRSMAMKPPSPNLQLHPERRKCLLR